MDQNQVFSSEIFAQAIGQQVLQYLKSTQAMDQLIQNAQSAALSTLEQIKQVLDDQTLDDPECFHRIEAIIEVFRANGLNTSRHDWG